MRGKLVEGRCDLADRGLIPACAGKTTGASATRLPTWAHPRVCGENVDWFDRLGGAGGSSPRVRGKRGPGTPRPGLEGLIPACAGKTPHRRRIRRFHRAHPRVCGENSCEALWVEVAVGSSPRVRGKHTARHAARLRPGLIPACAGKTTMKLKMLFERWAHPRVCGENSVQRTKSVAASGSSPRVRGKRERLQVSM